METRKRVIWAEVQCWHKNRRWCSCIDLAISQYQGSYV